MTTPDDAKPQDPDEAERLVDLNMEETFWPELRKPPHLIAEKAPVFPCTLLYFNETYGWQSGYFVNGGQDYFIWKKPESLLPWTHWQEPSAPLPTAPTCTPEGAKQPMHAYDPFADCPICKDMKAKFAQSLTPASATPCPDCRGTGVITAEYGPVNCPTCHGLGKAETPRTQLAQLVTECDRLRADNLMLERNCYLGKSAELATSALRSGR